MDISYLGHASFRFRGKKTTVVTDPFDPRMVGTKFPKIDADIITVSHHHEDHNAIANISGNPFIVDGPGEYEIQGVRFIGLSSFHDNNKGKDRGENTIFAIELDGVHIVHLGDLGEMLSEKTREKLGTVDVLCIPVGGVYTIDEKQAVELISEIEPSIVIPMHYGRPDINQEVFGSLRPLSSFLKLVGQEQAQPVTKLMVTKDKIPDHTQIVIFS